MLYVDENRDFFPAYARLGFRGEEGKAPKARPG